MASPSLAALLSQHAPVKTRKGLILTGLQNDFLSPEGKLPVSIPSGFVDRLSELVTQFREYGDVIWVRSHFVDNRAVNEDDECGDAVIVGPGASNDVVPPLPTTPSVKDDPTGAVDDTNDDHPPSPSKKARLSSEALDVPIPTIETAENPPPQQPTEPDEELFLTRTSNREPCCLPGSFGAEYATQVKDLVDERRDLQLIKTYYSAFASTSLLGTLRAKLVTELYICGCTTNLSLFATAVDAARHGISVTLVDDCLGYRRRDRHDQAIKELHELMGARLMTSGKVIERLKNPLAYVDDDDEEEDSGSDDSQLAVETDNDEEDETALVATSPLRVEDEDQDEEALVANVRLTRLGEQTISLQETSPIGKRSSLPEAAATEVDHQPTTESGEPSQSRVADTISGDGSGSSTTINASLPVSRSSQNHLDSGIGRATAARRCSVTINKNESSGGVMQSQWQGWEAINQEWAAFNKASRPDPRSSHTGLSAMSAIAGLDQKTVDEYERMMADARSGSEEARAGTQEGKIRPLFGLDKVDASAGSRIHYDLLPPDVAEAVFDGLQGEVNWQTMRHQYGEVPRLVCCQGTIDEDGSMPVYRHPSDQTLPLQSWTPTVDKVRKAAEAIAGHEVNHVLIQLYRNGKDFISEHSDKTLDIKKGTSIVNVSFGAQRTMRLRTKRVAASLGPETSPSRTTHRVSMPHNSMIVMTLPTNAEYLHGINADRRPNQELSEEETAYGGQRISLTFRGIGTYLNQDSSRIWGQGATVQQKELAREVLNANAEESERLVRAFGKENSASSIEWDSIYGGGFDVLHLR